MCGFSPYTPLTIKKKKSITTRLFHTVFAKVCSLFFNSGKMSKTTKMFLILCFRSKYRMYFWQPKVPSPTGYLWHELNSPTEGSNSIILLYCR